MIKGLVSLLLNDQLIGKVIDIDFANIKNKKQITKYFLQTSSGQKYEIGISSKTIRNFPILVGDQIYVETRKFNLSTWKKIKFVSNSNYILK